MSGSFPSSNGCPAAGACPSPTASRPLDGYDQWTDITPLSPVQPPPLAYATMEYDPWSNALLMFGGFDVDAGGAVDYTWEFKSYVWTNLTPTLLVSPPARYHAAMAVTLFPEGLILFGGQSDGTHVLGDTWWWNGTGWVQEAVTGLPAPAPRTGASFAFDYADSYSLLFGGTNGTYNFNDTWYNWGLQWTQLHPTTAPAGRYFAALTWDEGDQYDVLFGGTANAGTGLDDTWSFTAGNWTLRHAGTPPPDLILSGGSNDYKTGEMLLFGGFNPGNCTTTADTWWYASDLWRVLTSPEQGYPAPSPRDGFVMAYDYVTHYVVLFGGETGVCSPLQNVNDTWIYGPWTGPPPSPLAITMTPSPSSGPAPLSTTYEVHVTGGVGPYAVHVDPGDGGASVSTSSTGFANLTHLYADSENVLAVASATDQSFQTVTASAVLSIGSVMVGDWLPPRDTYQFSNYGSFWSGGGNCYGISASEILYWGHDIRGWSETPYLPTNVPSTSWLIPPPNVTSELNSVTLAIMQHQVLSVPAQWPWYYWSSSLPGNWQYLLSALQYGVPELMGLGWTNLHAVVVYGEQRLSNGTYLLDISDPNVPLTTTHAWYDPNANSFLYSAAGLTWNGFDYLGSGLPQELQPSWYGPLLAPNWNYTDFPIVSYGYYLIAAGQPVTVTTEQGTDSFTIPGNSQSFVQGIPESAGIEEGSVQAYAVPYYAFSGSAPVVKDPSAGSSPVQVLTVMNHSGTISVDGFSLALDSTGVHDFELQPHAQGFTLTLGNSTNDSAWTNVSFYSLTAHGTLQLNATLLRFHNGDVANFSVDDPSGLDSTTTPSVTVTVTPAGGASPATYHLANGQVGLSPAPPPPVPPTGGNATPPPWYLSGPFLAGVGVGAAVAGVVLAAVWLVRRPRAPRVVPSPPPGAH
jgi:hypothetical protein